MDPRKQPAQPQDGRLHQLRETLATLHREAVESRIQLEVFTGSRDAVFLSEFEHAFSHTVAQILQGDPPSEIPHVRSHLQRIVVEAREYIAEQYLVAINDRLDPFRRHPRTARLLMIDRPQRFDEFHGRERQIRTLLIAGRAFKGHDGNYEKARDAFKEAVNLAAELDADLPPSKFNERLFSVIWGAILMIAGAALGIAATKLI